MIAELVTLAFLLAALVVLWLVWRARTRERERAEHAERMAEHWHQLLESSREVAHDVNGLLSAAFVSLSSFAGAPPEAAPTDEGERRDRRAHASEAEIVQEMSEAVKSAIEMLRALRAHVDGGFSEVSTQGIVRLQASLHRARVPVDLRVEGDLPHGGEGEAAARVVGNLFANAVRAAEEAGGPVVVELRPDSLRMTNAVSDPDALGDDIYERGVSGAGSSGRGLHIAREMARRAGWDLRHRVQGREVTFEVRARRRGSRSPAT